MLQLATPGTAGDGLDLASRRLSGKRTLSLQRADGIVIQRGNGRPVVPCQFLH